MKTDQFFNFLNQVIHLIYYSFHRFNHIIVYNFKHHYEFL